MLMYLKLLKSQVKSLFVSFYMHISSCLNISFSISNIDFETFINIGLKLIIR